LTKPPNCGAGAFFLLPKKIHSRTRRVKAALAGNLRRASYTITNRAGLVLPHNFQNSPPLASPFMAND